MPGNLPAMRNAARRATIVSLGALLWFCTLAPHAWSRDWKPTPAVEAREYAMITDARKAGDMRMIFWLAPPMMPDPRAQQLLASYVVIGVSHAHGTPAGVMSFDDIDTLQAKDASGQPLKLLTGDQIPPVVAGTVTMLESLSSRSFGPFGKGFHWFVFDAGAVNACKAGGLSVPFADEIYTYQTPIPGCVN
jgi:hypothetical protein